MRLALLAALAALALACPSREEKLNAAEDKAKLLAETKARIAKGVGEAMKGEGKTAAESVSEGAGEMVKGLAKGVDTSLNAVKVTVAAPLAEQGIQVTRAARGEGSDKGHVISAYVVLDKPFAGKLEMRAYDAAKQEVGRAQLDVAEKAATAKYVDFAFDKRTPLTTAAGFELR